MDPKNLLSYQLLPKNAPTILFLHGFLGSAAQWDPIIYHYKKSFQILLLELPGHGVNDCEASYSIEDLAADVNMSLMQCGIKAVHFVGHSMGGYVGCAFAKAYSDKLLSLTLINSCATADATDRQMQRNRALKLVEKYPNAFTSMAITNLFTSVEREHFTTEIELMKSQAMHMSTSGISNAIKAMRDRASQLNTLKNAGFPIQYIYGSRDEVISKEVIEEEIELLNVEFAELDSGHMSLITHPNKIVELHFI